MSIPIFAFETVQAATITASAGSATDHGTDQLQDNRLSTYWQSGAVTDLQTLKFDFGSARAVDSIAIGNHNFNSVGVGHTVTVEYSSNDADWSTFGTFITFTDTVLYMTAASQSKRYWRLVFDNDSALDAAPRIGMISIGTKFQTTYPYDRKPRKGTIYETALGKAVSGVFYASQTYAGRTVFEIRYPLIPSADESEFQRMFTTIRGRLMPFFFRWSDDVWYVVRLMADENLTERETSIVWNTDVLRLEEEL